MDADKKARFIRNVGFICLGLALLNATFAVLAMVDEKNVRKGAPGIAIAASMFTIGIVCLTRGQRGRLWTPSVSSDAGPLIGGDRTGTGCGLTVAAPDTVPAEAAAGCGSDGADELGVGRISAAL